MWKPLPLHAAILEILRRSGSCSDEDLMKALKKEHNDVGPETLNKTLLRLEVRGLINVSNYTRGRKKIEINPA